MFVIPNTVQILDFEIWDTWETLLDSPKPPVPSTSPHFGVRCRSILIYPFPQKHQPGTGCRDTFFHVGEDENVSGMLSSSLSPLPSPTGEKNSFLCFWLLSSSFPPFLFLSLFFFFGFFGFFCKITVILDSEATETQFSNLVKLYWWFNIQLILLHAHWMTREKLDHKHFFFLSFVWFCLKAELLQRIGRFTAVSWELY